MRSAYLNLSTGLVLAAVAGALITIMSEMPGQFTWAGIDFRIVLGLAGAGGLALAAYSVRQLFFMPAPQPAQRARADAQLIFRSMIALAGANGDIHIDEIQAIQRCCSQVFKREMNYSEIRQAFDHHQSTNFGGFAFEGADERASPEARPIALNAAAVVAASDSEITPAEREKLGRLAELLGLSPADLAAALAAISAKQSAT